MSTPSNHTIALTTKEAVHVHMHQPWEKMHSTLTSIALEWLALHAQHSQVEMHVYWRCSHAIRMHSHVQPWCAQIECVLTCNVSRHIWHSTTSTKCACHREHMCSNYTSCKFIHWLLPPQQSQYSNHFTTCCEQYASRKRRIFMTKCFDVKCWICEMLWI